MDQTCSFLVLPVTIVKPDWYADGNYVGIADIHGAISFTWEKEDHFYYESTSNFQTTRVWTPLNQLGEITQRDVNIMIPGRVDPKIFEVPTYCTLNATVIENFKIAHASFGIFETRVKVPEKLAVNPDPVGCFLEADSP